MKALGSYLEPVLKHERRGGGCSCAAKFRTCFKELWEQKGDLYHLAHVGQKIDLAIKLL